MLAVCFLFGVCPLFVGSSAAEEVEFDVLVRITAPVEPSIGMDPFISGSGAFMLRWQLADEASSAVVVERSEASDFAGALTVYTGRDDRTYVSGLSAGRYYYRVRLDDAVDRDANAVSSALVVEVEYQPLARVFALMALGALTFLATVAIIIGGTIRFKRQREMEAERG
jgi:hypothetical protein